MTRRSEIYTALADSHIAQAIALKQSRDQLSDTNHAVVLTVMIRSHIAAAEKMVELARKHL